MRRRVASTSIMPRSRLWQSGGMKCGMWNTPRFTFSSSCRRLSSSKGSAPCRRDRVTAGADRRRAGMGAGARAGGASPQAGRTESRRSSTRLPCGHRTSLPVDSTGVGAGAGPGSFRGSRGPRGESGRSWPRGRRQGQEARPRPGGPRSPGQGGPLGGTGTRVGARGGLATYPDHLRAGIVGGPGGKGSSQGRRLSTHRAPSRPAPCASGPAPGPQQVETEGGALPAPRSAPTANSAWDGCPTVGSSGPPGGPRALVPIPSQPNPPACSWGRPRPGTQGPTCPAQGDGHQRLDREAPP